MLKRALLTTLILLPISGCSVFMAASSSGEPDLSVLKTGAPRQMVEQNLGRPIIRERLMNGDVATYQFVTGDTRSYGRAAAYAVADVLTFGLAELFTFRIEALQGDKHTVTVEYDLAERLRSAEIASEAAPMAQPRI